MIRYAEFNDYDRRRQDANTAINAMLAGCRLASHVLTLTHGASRPLAEIFPSIPRIKLLNLRTDVASRVLNDAEHHLGLMAVPYLQAIHEDYGIGCLALLRDSGFISSTQVNAANASNLHAKFTMATGVDLEPEAREIFQVLRLLRNAVVHRGSSAGDEIVTACAEMSSGAQKLWMRITSQTHPRYERGEPVRLGFSETIAELAVTKRLAREMNLVMGNVMPRAFWLGRLADDFDSLRDVPPQADKRVAIALRLGNFDYGPLKFEQGEVEAELDRRGLLRATGKKERGSAN